jgi:MacB-like protein
VIGIEPAAGRLLGPDDDSPSPSSPAAVISDRYWQRRFGGSPSAIGQSFTVRDRTFAIVGVMPPSYQSARPGRVPDLMLPLLMMMSDGQRSDAGFNSLTVLARLKKQTCRNATPTPSMRVVPLVCESPGPRSAITGAKSPEKQTRWWAHFEFTRINIDVITTSTSSRSA